MPIFEVEVGGRNLLLAKRPSTGPWRFETRMLLAATSQDAVLILARRLTENHPQLRKQLVNPEQDPPLIFARVLGLCEGVPDENTPFLNFQPESEGSTPEILMDLFD